MKHEKLKFPSFESLKKLPLCDENNEYIEYEFTIFEFGLNSRCRITLNEDSCKGFFADVLGDDGKIFRTFCEKPVLRDTYVYKMTKSDYNKMCKKIQLFYDYIIEKILSSNNDNSKFWNEHQ